MSKATTPLRLGVLASGKGTNLQAIIDACADKRLNAIVKLVISDKPKAFALERAQKAGIKTSVVNNKQFSERRDFDAQLMQQLDHEKVDLVVLAGFMRILSDAFVDHYAGRLINIHPALLPNFPGLHAIRQAWDHGAKVTGCTVHFVDKGVDTGPIILQASVAVTKDDTLQSLEEKIHQQEHRLLVETIDLISRGAIRLNGRDVIISR